MLLSYQKFATQNYVSVLYFFLFLFQNCGIFFAISLANLLLINVLKDFSFPSMTLKAT